MLCYCTATRCLIFYHTTTPVFLRPVATCWFRIIIIISISRVLYLRLNPRDSAWSKILLFHVYHRPSIWLYYVISFIATVATCLMIARQSFSRSARTFNMVVVKIWCCFVHHRTASVTLGTIRQNTRLIIILR